MEAQYYFIYNLLALPVFQRYRGVRIGQKVDIEHSTQISWLNQSTGVAFEVNKMSVSIQALLQLTQVTLVSKK